MKIYCWLRMLKRWMWEKKAGVFQQPLDAACFNPACNAKTLLCLKNKLQKMYRNFKKKSGKKYGVTPFRRFTCKTCFTLNGSLMMISSRLTIGRFLEILLSPNSRQGLRMRLQMRMPATWQQLGSGKNCSAHAYARAASPII